MGLYIISGLLTICLSCYLFYCLRHSQRKNTLISSVTYIVLCFIFILGLVGLFNKALEGTNYIIVGIFMIGICSKAHHSGGGGEYMYMRGWLAAIVSLIYGILKVLGML